MQTVTLSEAAVAVLRFEIRGWKAKRKGARLAAYRELAAAGIREPVPGTEADYRFTDEGSARREEILRRRKTGLSASGMSRRMPISRSRPRPCCGGSRPVSGW